MAEASVAASVKRAPASAAEAATARRMQLLLLCDVNWASERTIVDHARAIATYSRHDVKVLPMRGDLPRGLEVARFDAVVIHYSLAVASEACLSAAARASLRRYAGLKAAFVQDDYRWVNRTVAALAFIGVDLLFALAPEDMLETIYPSAELPGLRKITVLAGYAPEELTQVSVPAYQDRPIDVGYRARKLPAWLGSHGQEKWRIGERFLADAPGYGLRCDIAWREADRIYGDAWPRFVMSCKAMLGTESGAGVCDFTGEIQHAVERHELAAPDTPFETLRELYFKDDDGKVPTKVISPRCFEAAALRTLMILYEGRYSGILEPWRHYVPLRRDHSNMAEVVAVLRDPGRAGEIIERAYREIALNPAYSFRAMVAAMDRALEAAATESTRPATLPSYSIQSFNAAVRTHRRRQAFRQGMAGLTRRGYGVVFGKLLKLLPDTVNDGLRLGAKRAWVRVRGRNRLAAEPRGRVARDQ